MQNSQADKKPLRVGYTTPGWPMSRFPNGIVTYVNNIVAGFDRSVKPIVLAAPLIGDEVSDQFVDLSKLNARKNWPQQLTDKILAKLNNQYTQPMQYQSEIRMHAKKIALATQQLPHPLDILEMEESFGTASFLFNTIKVPIVTRIHGPWFTMKTIMQADANWDYQFKVHYEGESIKRAHGLSSPSLDVLNKVREYYQIDLPHARVIANPVQMVSPDKQWQYAANTNPTVLFVGRFDSHKGGDLMLNAFRIMASKHKQIELIFVGPDKEVVIEGVRYNIERFVQRFMPDQSINKRVQFLGHCDQSRIAVLRKQAHVTVVCSRYENFPLSLLEALATGSPVVATAVGGIKEIIVDNYNGFFAEPDSAESIAEKTLALINDVEKMQIFSKNAIQDTQKRFSPSIIAAQTADYYRSVLAQQ